MTAAEVGMHETLLYLIQLVVDRFWVYDPAHHAFPPAILAVCAPLPVNQRLPDF